MEKEKKKKNTLTGTSGSCVILGWGGSLANCGTGTKGAKGGCCCCCDVTIFDFVPVTDAVAFVIVGGATGIG